MRKASFLLPVVLLFALIACSDSDPVATLLAQQYRSGDYVAARIYGYHLLRQDDWVYEYFEFQDVAITITDNAVGGTATVSELSDGNAATRFGTNGETYNGWTVGETVTITGSVSGSVISLHIRNSSGAVFEMEVVPYDGDVYDYDTDFRFMMLEWIGGNAQSSTAGSYPASDAYIEDLEWVGTPTRAPDRREVTIGSGNSVYRNGVWEGSTSSYVSNEMRIELDPGSYWEIEFAYALSFSGNSISGTATLESADGEDDWNGFAEGTEFTVSGVVRGAVIELMLQNGSFSYRVELAPSPGTDGYEDSLGDIGYMNSSYGVSTDTDDYFAGEVHGTFYHENTLR